jgi:hypothetical protein
MPKIIKGKRIREYVGQNIWVLLRWSNGKRTIEVGKLFCASLDRIVLTDKSYYFPYYYYGHEPRIETAWPLEPIDLSKVKKGIVVNISYYEWNGPERIYNQIHGPVIDMYDDFIEVGTETIFIRNILKLYYPPQVIPVSPEEFYQSVIVTKR